MEHAWELCERYSVGPPILGHESLRQLGVLSSQGQKFPCMVSIGVVWSKIDNDHREKEKSKTKSVI